jgi:hypothetical protein
MLPGVDPRVRRFIEHHAVSIEAEVEADVAEARASSPAERWRQLEQLTGVLSWLRASGTTDPARVVEWRDPPHPTYGELIARLRRGGRAP